MIKKITQVEQDVRYVLRTEEKSRDDDMHLILKVWKQQLRFKEFNMKNVYYNCSPPESITRCRRKLQENGEYLSSKKVAEGRRVEQKTMQKVIPTLFQV